MGFLSIAVSAKLVMRYGVRIPLAVGLAAAGLGLCSSRGRRSTAATS